MFERFFAMLNFLVTFHIFLQSLNGKWRLYFQSVFWVFVGAVSLFFCDNWVFDLDDKIDLAIMGLCYLLVEFATVLLVTPLVSFILTWVFRRNKHVKKLLKCFLELLVVWFTTLLKAAISETVKEGQIAPYILLVISIYFILVILVEIVFTSKDFGLVNSTTSVIVLLLTLGGLGFWAVPISTIVVFLKTLMMAECCEECRERKKTKRQEEEDAYLEWLKVLVWGRVKRWWSSVKIFFR